MAAQAIGQDDVGLDADAEEAALVGRRQGLEALAAVVQAQQQALLPGDEHLLAIAGDGGQVVAGRVVGTVRPGLPALATVAGTEYQVEGADHEAVLRITEPDIEKGLVGAFGFDALAFVEPLRGVGAACVVVLHQAAELAAIKLLLPAGATVTAVQHDAVVPYRPAVAGCGEVHGIEIGTDRNAGLGPAGALIVGIKDMAALADCDQPLTGLGHVQQRAAYRQLAALGRQVEHIDQGLGLGITRHQGHAQNDELDRKHRDVL
ncbi:hypothetical protein D9M72_293510 [compost metagenome]